MSFTSEQKLTPRLLIFLFPGVSPIAQGLMPKWPFQEACTQHSDFLGCPHCSMPSVPSGLVYLKPLMRNMTTLRGPEVDWLIGLICYGEEGVCSYHNRHWISISIRFWQHHHPQIVHSCLLVPSSLSDGPSSLPCVLPTFSWNLKVGRGRGGETHHMATFVWRERSRWLSQQLLPRASVWLVHSFSQGWFLLFLMILDIR